MTLTPPPPPAGAATVRLTACTEGGYALYRQPSWSHGVYTDHASFDLLHVGHMHDIAPLHCGQQSPLIYSASRTRTTAAIGTCMRRSDERAAALQVREAAARRTL